MTAALFLILGELAAEGTPCQLPLSILETVDQAGFHTTQELRRGLLLAETLAESDGPAEALARYEEARRWQTWVAAAPVTSTAPLEFLADNGTEARR